MELRRRIAKENRLKARPAPCILCGSTPADSCHIRSKGSGGPEEAWNIVRMCRNHHQEQHRIGWPQFLIRYPSLNRELVSMGWNTGADSFSGRPWHPNLAKEQT